MGTETDRWVDMAGLIAPKSEIEKLIARIVSEDVTVQSVQQELNGIFEKYDDFSLNFALNVLCDRKGKTLAEIDEQDIADILEKGEKAELTFNDLILRDAKKEFSSVSKIGFGIDGDDAEKNADFEATRGTYESHPFVIERMTPNP
ncbi:MAG: DUF4954 family protein [Paludibacter sp.]